MATQRQRRRTLIDLALRRQRPGTGTNVDVLRERTAVSRYPDLRSILAGLAWAVVGGVATRLYMPERLTLDLDVAVTAADAEEVRRRLGEGGFRYSGELTIGGSSWTSLQNASVDVLEVDTPWIHVALAEAQANPDQQGMPVLPLPYLALMKFQAGRLQDLADVSRMLGQASDASLDRVRRLFQRFAAEDMQPRKPDHAWSPRDAAPAG